jgi:hypothetical protein
MTHEKVQQAMNTDPDKPIDEALDKVLRAAGSRLDNYTMPKTREAMREAMREVMRAAWVEGSDAGWKAARGKV